MVAIVAMTLLDPTPGVINTLRDIDFGGLSGAGLFVVVVGVVYRIFDARHRLTGFSWRPIQENIENKLLTIIRTAEALSGDQEAYLREKRRLLDLFYKLLDNDESLKSRQEGVRFNGLVVTSALDLSVIALLGWLFHFCFALARGSFAHVVWTTACSSLWIVAQAIFVPRALARHQELSNEQLDFIDTHHRDDVLRFAKESLSLMPHTDS
jgi:hypothetical protein